MPESRPLDPRAYELILSHFCSTERVKLTCSGAITTQGRSRTDTVIYSLTVTEITFIAEIEVELKTQIERN